MTTSSALAIGHLLVPGVKCLIHPPAGSSQMILFTILEWKIVASDFPLYHRCAIDLSKSLKVMHKRSTSLLFSLSVAAFPLHVNAFTACRR